MRRPTRRSIFGSRFGRSRRRPTPSSRRRSTPSSNRRLAQRNAMSLFNRSQRRATSRSRARPTQARRRSRPSIADIYKRSPQTRRRNTGLRDRRMSPTQARRSRSPMGRRSPMRRSLASNRRAIGRFFNRRRR